MARQPRLDLPGIAQHVVQRGNDRHVCFAADTDYLRYLQELREASSKHDCAIHAYVLMTNHVHLLATPATTGGISRMMQAVGRRYVGSFNARYRRTGTLWEGRFNRAGRHRPLSAHLQPLHRAQSRPSPYDQRPRRLPVVELPPQRTGTVFATDHSTRAIHRAGRHT
jgi:REP element-mobilizing transposase RayT